MFKRGAFYMSLSIEMISDMKKILLAESIDVMPAALTSLGLKCNAFPMVGNSLSGKNFQIIPCVTLEAAIARAYDQVDLILCGLHFDDSRMFDLLRSVKATPALRHIPFLCVKTTEGVLEPTFYESVRIATRALGAADFVDLSESANEQGAEQAVRRITRYIDSVLSK